MRSRNLMSVVTLLLALVASLAVSTAAAPSASSASYGSQVRSVDASFDSQVLYWTNVQRAKFGLRTLASGPCVDRFAENWTVKLAARDSFSHQGLRPILKRCHRRTAAENIATASGALSAYDVVQAWMRSPGHRKNILNGRYKALGVSAWRSASTGRLYVTQDFAG